MKLFRAVTLLFSAAGCATEGNQSPDAGHVKRQQDQITDSKTLPPMPTRDGTTSNQTTSHSSDTTYNMVPSNTLVAAPAPVVTATTLVTAFLPVKSIGGDEMIGTGLVENNNNQHFIVNIYIDGTRVAMDSSAVNAPTAAASPFAPPQTVTVISTVHEVPEISTPLPTQDFQSASGEASSGTTTAQSVWWKEN